MKVISGGQTGVDRAALDAALSCGLTCGGWCPKGRRAEDGVIDVRYPLIEAPSAGYRQRTEWNVRDSDGTLILHRGDVLRGGTALTRDLALRRGKPCLVVNLEPSPTHDKTLSWLSRHTINTLNVAGPRESQQPGIYHQSLACLQRLFNTLQEIASGQPDRHKSPPDR
ncbi:MAG: molybdenum cofactor carrier [Proteobacteria bacterium]|nr:MAG: molybdenum cofactor carrier [Pseudomonadota bacterium]